MKAVTILGRGSDWTEMFYQTEELWGTMTCLLEPGLCDKPFSKVFAFDGVNCDEIKMSLEIAKKRDIPVVSNEEYATEVYPLIAIGKKLKTTFLKNSISYMMAYALFQEYTRIYIHGIGGDKTLAHQLGRRFILFWDGFARGYGVDIRLGRSSQKWLYESDLYHLPEVSAEDLKTKHGEIYLGESNLYGREEEKCLI